MRFFLVLILSLSAFNVFANEAKTEKKIRKPAATYGYICAPFNTAYPDNIYEVAKKVLTERCDPDRYTQVFTKNDAPYSYCCVSK